MFFLPKEVTNVKQTNFFKVGLRSRILLIFFCGYILVLVVIKIKFKPSVIFFLFYFFPLKHRLCVQDTPYVLSKSKKDNEEQNIFRTKVRKVMYYIK